MRYDTPEIGIDSIGFWEHVVRSQPGVAALAIFHYTPQPPLQLRLPRNSPEQEVIARAVTFARQYRTPFWDAVLLEAINADRLTDLLLNEINLPHPSHIKPILIERRSLLEGELRDRVSAAGSGKVTALLSEVFMDTGMKMHFPMLDFRCRADRAGLDAASRIARRLLPNSGTLLSSGRSYHAVGRELIRVEQLQRFLIDSLFYGPIVDRLYVAHHLRRGLCTLRISTDQFGSTPSILVNV